MGQVYIPQDMDYPALRMEVDRVHAAELGLTQKEIVDNVITALNSNAMIAPNYWSDKATGNNYFLTVQYYENGTPAIHNLLDLKNIPLRAPDLKEAHYSGFGGQAGELSEPHGSGSLSDSAHRRRLCHDEIRRPWAA